MNINFDPSGRPPKGVLTQVLTVILGVVALGVALMFSLVVFAVIAVAALVFWLYFWWKTRALRSQMRERTAERGTGRDFEPSAPGPSPGGEVIEGEAVRVSDSDHKNDQP